MLQNSLVIFLRNLKKNRTASILNIIGLCAGLTCFALIALWVKDETSYDKFNASYDRIFRLVGTARTGTGIEESAVSSAPMAAALRNDYAEVENTVRLRLREEIITHNGQQVLQPGILVADPSFFDVFSYHLTSGSAATALTEPYSIVLTESMAKKYFGDNDPLGKTLLMNMYDSAGYGALYTVTGTMPDAPQNAHFTFNMIASFKTVEVANPDVLTTDGWGDASFYTYLLLKKGVDGKAFSKKISHFYAKYVGDMAKVWEPIYSYKLQPLADIHLRSHLEHELTANGSITQVYIFATIGIFILLLAGINYTNLATASSISRAKEVGIKKVAGASKNQLVWQYLLESVFTALIALFFALLFCTLLQPVFYQVTDKNISLLSSIPLVAFLICVTVFLGLLSGIYPAIIMTSFKPATILKGAFKSTGQGIRLRTTLVVAQFVITIVLVTGIVIVYSQMSFIKHKDLGYNKDALLYLKVNGNIDVVKGYQAFKNEVESSPLVSGMATSNSMIVGGLGTGGAETVDDAENPLQINTARLRVDNNYLDVYGIKLLAGRNFTAAAATDTIRQVILNETAVKKIGWKNNEVAIGRPFRMGGTKGVVVGIVNDFHFNTLGLPIEALAIYPLEVNFSRITLKADTRKIDDAIALVETTWKKHFHAALFDYDFVSQQIKQQYKSEEKFSNVFLYFSLLSLLIACLGLYGLLAFTIFQKTKEIGIRKVLGATTGRIAMLLSANFVKLVVIACVIGVPLAWYLMNQWLQNFAYRVTLSWWMFAAAGVLVLIIALMTVSVQAIRAAVANPVKNLRTE